MEGPSPETLGQYLKRERESRSVALEELSRATRINLPFLEALERDDFQIFSQPQFILGFLRGYARHLGIDSREVLNRYRLQSELARRKETFRQLPLFQLPTLPDEKVDDPKPLPQRIPPPKARGRSRRNILIQVAIVAVAVGLSLYIHYLLKQKDASSVPSHGGFQGGTSPQNTGKSSKTKRKIDSSPTPAETILPKDSPGKKPEYPKTEARKDYLDQLISPPNQKNGKGG